MQLQVWLDFGEKAEIFQSNKGTCCLPLTGHSYSCRGGLDKHKARRTVISANEREFKICADGNLLLVKIFFEEASQCRYCKKPVWVCGKSKLTLMWDFF